MQFGLQIGTPAPIALSGPVPGRYHVPFASYTSEGCWYQTTGVLAVAPSM
jgi:hypothetical protein